MDDALTAIAFRCDLLEQAAKSIALAGIRLAIPQTIADVDALIHQGSALDADAALNTTSVYTPAINFPKLPEALFTDLTSLNEAQDRLALVVDMVFNADGSALSSGLYRAQVHNHAKLAYNSLAAWLTGSGPAPQRIGITVIIVQFSLDWSYYLVTRNGLFARLAHPAIVIGGLLPIFGTLLLLIIAFAGKNRPRLTTGSALGQAALLGYEYLAATKPSLAASRHRSKATTCPPPTKAPSSRAATASNWVFLKAACSGVGLPPTTPWPSP